MKIENEKLIKTLKTILKDHSKSENLLSDVIMSICFNNFKIKFIENSKNENNKENINFYLIIFTNLFPEYPKPSLNFLPKNHIEKVISNLDKNILMFKTLIIKFKKNKINLKLIYIYI